MLEASADWSRYVERAVDDLLEELGVDSAAYGPLGERVDIESTFVRERLSAFAVNLLAAAQAGTGSLECDDGRSVVDCTFVLRPDQSPYYRCLGHAPPHCYDANQQTIACP